METMSLSNGTELRITDNGKIELILDCESNNVQLDKFCQGLYGKFIDAIKLFSDKGLLLGNYHYDVDRYEKENGDIEVYLTRYYEECENCPLFEKECQGDVPPLPNDKYACHNMKPIFPYEEQGYEFYDMDEINEHTEFTDIERIALEMIWKFPNVLCRLYNPNMN
jgi:hypothetical protein